MERLVIEYLANALWQLPVLALGAWLLLMMWSPGPVVRHRVWLAVLALGLLLPLRGAIGPVPPEGNSAASTMSDPMVAFAALQQGPSAQLETASDPRAIGIDGGWAVVAALGAYLHRVSVSAVVLNWIVGLWLAVALWGLARLAIAWRSACRLVAHSRDTVPGEREREALRECARRIGVKAPELRESGALAGPVVVGATRPVLLWPEGFAQFSGNELQAALFHELAHVRRRDYGMNLLCEAAALPLKWHPVTHAVERQIRATREMACDAIAAEAMESEAVYAECLVSLARSIAGGGFAESPAVAGLFNGNVMEERVMRLMRGKSAMSMRTRIARSAAGASAMVVAIALAGAFHVVPAMAQDAPVAPVAPPAPPQAVAPPALAVPPPPTAQIGTPPLTEPVVEPAPPAAPRIPAAGAPVPPMSATAPPAPPRIPAASQVLAAPPAPPSVRREKPVIMMNGQERELTPAERARIERQLAEAQRKIAAATTKINSPEFRKQIEDAQAKALKAKTMLNSAEFKRQMADAQKQIAEATAKINSPEFRKKIQAEIDAAAKVNGEEFQKQMADAQKEIAAAMSSPEFKKQMADAQKQVAEATARLNSPEFRKQIEEAARAAAKVNSAEFQKQMADAQKQVADAMAKMKAEQKKKSGEKGAGTKVQGPEK
jgi:beta-lactamase regulating signal transducer with metallopeptidase domain